jgi:hypothetical protein
MAGTTPKGFRYPEDSDAPNIAVDIENLASDVDTELDDYLTTASAASTYQPNVITTEGDLIVGDSSGDPDRLPIGALGTVLTSDGDTAEWAAPSGGGMVSLSSGSLTGSIVNITSIPQDYKDLYLVIRQFRGSVDNEEFALRINGDSNLRYFQTNTNTVSNQVFTSRTSIPFSGGVDNTATNTLAKFYVTDYTNTLTWKLVEGIGLWSDDITVANANGSRIWGGYDQTAAITELNILPVSGTFNGGTFILYGVR